MYLREELFLLLLLLLLRSDKFGVDLIIDIIDFDPVHLKKMCKNENF